ncbi:SpoIID/LytB domain-containing protein [Bacillus songklensis]|uniref:SpoIID/LytB domain-containing protein n=1 Tax=Bacillus songklensis TaxID=1069116 RepID=A0ABV8B9E5_9BACI
MRHNCIGISNWSKRNRKNTSSHRVTSIEIGGKKFEGKDVRDILGLNSTDFTFERKGEQVMVTTRGYGHGVGMSQYGANGMAKEGKNYRDIVNYYYRDIEIDHVDSLQDIEQLIVKNNIGSIK